MRGGGGGEEQEGTIEVMDNPPEVIDGVLQVRQFPVKYTVDEMRLYDHSEILHISNINDESLDPPIKLVVRYDATKKAYNLSTMHNNPFYIKINGTSYIPNRIIPRPSATASV